ncbi:MAG: UV DNA damage repair endonuclease UvsE [Candidatus Zixiibacteriota bacterium]|nr:MAG: UV DNA damage repair endonuclease UvsE [candidate division Zixibacteria bacterium]
MKNNKKKNLLRLGLCCVFKREPIKFRTTTAAALQKFNRRGGLERLSEIVLHNANSLKEALEYCGRNQIGAFRVKSELFPLRTHPVAGYELKELPEWERIHSLFKKSRLFAKKHDIRLTFHPDQFVVLNSPRPEVVVSSISELEHHGEMAEFLGADVINVHAGGVYGDKKAALERLEKNIGRLSVRVRERLTLENDDKSYSPSDLLAFCRHAGIPFVYDVHHHRCLQDGITEEKTMSAAITTWDREPLFHISSPLNGWKGKNPNRHHDFVDIQDFPEHWLDLTVTVEVEAKAKELAVRRLQQDLHRVKYENIKKIYISI